MRKNSRKLPAPGVHGIRAACRMLRNMVLLRGNFWKKAALTFAVAAALGLGGESRAADMAWNVADGAWENQNNWNPVGTPGEQDTVIINNDGTARLGSWVSGSGITALQVGTIASGTLVFGWGGSVEVRDMITIADQAGSTGTITVDNSNNRLTCNSESYIGNFGNGTMELSGEGEFLGMGLVSIGVAAGPEGLVTVTGSGTLFRPRADLYVGQNGNGTLNISAGGTTEVDNHITIGAGSVTNDTAQGKVTVDGTGSKLQADSGPYSSVMSTLTVGDYAQGELILTGGGEASAKGDIFIGKSFTGNSSVNVGSGSTLESTAGNLYIGDVGTELLSGTGTVIANTAYLGSNGAIPPGDSGGQIGTLTFNGNVEMSSTSVYEVDVMPGDNTLKVGHRDSEAEYNSYFGSIYASRRFNRFLFSVGSTYGRHDVETTRYTIGLTQNQRLTGDYWATSGQVFAELALMAIQGHDGDVTPYLNFGWNTVRTDRFLESGGGAGLSADARNYNSLFGDQVNSNGGSATLEVKF